MTTPIDFMQSRLFKALRKRGISQPTALAACQQTHNKDLKKDTLNGHVLDLDSLVNIGLTREQALEMRRAFGVRDDEQGEPLCVMHLDFKD